MNKQLCLLLVLFHVIMLSATEVIRTSFEVQDGYPAGSLSNTNKWSVTQGTAQIKADSTMAHSGTQGLLLISNTKLQVGHIPHAKTDVGIGGVVFVDFYVRVISQPTSNFSFVTYDLSGGHRSSMVELTSAGKLKVYNGSSGYTNQPTYPLNEWMRLSMRIDHAAKKYQFALNGQVWPQEMAFREIKNGATDVDYHEFRISQSNGTGQVAIDDVVIGTDSIPGIYFPPLTISPIGSDSTDHTDSTVVPVIPTPDPAIPQTRRVTTASQLKSTLKIMNPGDSIILADGDYDISGTTVNRTGTQALPIIIIAEHPLGARMTGESHLTLRYVEYIEIHDLDWQIEHVSTIVKLEGCNHFRLTGCQMTMDPGTENKTSKWILIGDVWDQDVCISHHNRIDHNLFYNKLDGGAWLVIDGTHGTPHISQHDLIDHNTFRNNTPRMDNEKESIRIGVSDLCNLPAYTVVEDNLFEDCDGDPEIVSVKSYSDTVRNNTFRRCLGTVCLRQGWNSVVYDNVFEGEGKTGTFEDGTIGCGGVRIYGKGHEVYNNIFKDLTGSKWDAAITLTNGDIANKPEPSSSHPIPEDVKIHHNTFEGNVSNVEVGYTNSGKYGKKPVNCTFYENIIIGSDSLLTYHTTMSDSNFRWYNNYVGTKTSDLVSASAERICKKVLIDGQLFILKDNKRYTVLGK